MMKTYTIIFITALILSTVSGLTLDSLSANESPLSGKEIVALYRASLDQIKSIEADCVIAVDDNTLSGYDLDSESKAIVFDYHWYYDFDTEKEYQKGKGARSENGKLLHYREECRGYDGDVLYSYCTTSNSGLRQKGKWNEYGNSYFTFSNPLILLGKEPFTSEDRTYIDVLEENADSLEVKQETNGNITLSCHFRDYGETGKMIITIDPRHGYLPRYLEIRSVPEDVATTRMKVTDFTKTANEIWFPIRGRFERYYTEDPIPEDGVHYKNGMTVEEVMAMSMEERWKIAPELGFRSIPLSPPGVIHVNPTTLKINEPFDESLLKLDKFPDGMYVWDDILQLGYQVGRFDDPNYVETKKTTTGELVFRIVFVSIGFILVFSALGFILKKRFAKRASA